jgi:hypothetical protein
MRIAPETEGVSILFVVSLVENGVRGKANTVSRKRVMAKRSITSIVGSSMVGEIVEKP